LLEQKCLLVLKAVPIDFCLSVTANFIIQPEVISVSGNTKEVADARDTHTELQDSLLCWFFRCLGRFDSSSGSLTAGRAVSPALDHFSDVQRASDS